MSRRGCSRAGIEAADSALLPVATTLLVTRELDT
eukprot:gene26334-biopygen15905